MCDPNNRNQHFVRDGKLIRYAYDRNFCIDANNGRRAHMWRCDSNNNNQKVELQLEHQITESRQGKCLDNPGSERKNGGYIHMWNCSASNGNQRWNMKTLESNGVLLQQWGMTLEQAKLECEKRPDCKSFSWNPDDWTFLYDSSTENRQHRELRTSGEAR